MHQSIRHKLDFLKTLSIIDAPYGVKNMTLKILVALKKNKQCYSLEMESLRTSLASRTSLRIHFEVLGLGLEGQVLGLGPKLQVLKNCSARGSRTALLFVPLKTCWKIPEISRKLCEDFFCVFRNWKSLEKIFYSSYK